MTDFDGSIKFDTKIDTSGFESGLAKITKAALSAGAIAGAFKDVAKTGAQFSATMSQVGAISGATGADFDALTEKAKEMGAATVFSASQASEAMTYMAMAGWKTAVSRAL